MDDEYQGVVSQASFAMQGPLEVPIVNVIVSRLHRGSLVIDVYVGATGKYIRRKIRALPPSKSQFAWGQSFPKILLILVLPTNISTQPMYHRDWD